MTTSADMLGQSGILRNARIERYEFDPTKAAHLDSLRNYLLTGNWGDVMFYTEAPYLNVPETVLRKTADWALRMAGR